MLSAADKQTLFDLVGELTGANRSGDFGQESLVANVERRMGQLNVSSFNEYLKLVQADAKEYLRLISNLTIHTTSWFRENPHFVAFQEILLEALDRKDKFRLWCAACSTGEEVYSFAVMLEEFRRIHPSFDYEIVGTDIDAISLKTAERAIYPKKQINFHLSRYKAHLLEGSGATADYFTLSKSIRERCTFQQHDLRSSETVKGGPFYLCVCRNVLIYFAPEVVSKVIRNLLVGVKGDGYLMLGHSETIDGTDFGLTQRGHSVYARGLREEKTFKEIGKYRILSIDDSSVMRAFYSKTFTALGFECATVGTASEATHFLNFNDVDLITLDLNLPDKNGDKWLLEERAQGLKTPVVMISDVHPSGVKEVIDMLSTGIQDYIEKDRLKSDTMSLREQFIELIQAKGSGKGHVQMGGSPPTKRPDVILIGASTGGPQALVKLLAELPKDSPPILVTQHMSHKFMKPMAERLAETSGLTLGEVVDGETLKSGTIYMSYGDYHLGVVEAKDQTLQLKISNEQPFNGHRPSVDFLFNSILGATCNIMAVLLTGMGRDGALGMRFLHQEGSYCIAQSEKDSAVYGMPKEAIERGAVNFIGTIEEIRETILKSLTIGRS